jgi:hypothetical protein
MHPPDRRLDTPPAPAPPAGPAGPAANNITNQDLSEESQLFLRQSLDRALYKVTKYIALMESTPVYWAAMIVHPGYRKRWLELYLEREHKDSIIASARVFFDDNYPHIAPPATTTPEEDRRREHLTGPTHIFYPPPADPVDRDELTEYFNEHLMPVEDVLDWWSKNIGRFPRLGRMAFDLLSIPAMSTECERLFSQGKLVIGSQRHSLNDTSINMLMSLMNWLRIGVF